MFSCSNSNVLVEIVKAITFMSVKLNTIARIQEHAYTLITTKYIVNSSHLLPHRLLHNSPTHLRIRIRLHRHLLRNLIPIPPS